MSILIAEKRDLKIKGKQLRRAGFVPGVLYGGNLDVSLGIQIPQKEAAHFLKSNPIGSAAEIIIDEKKYNALLKEVTYTTVVNNIEHLSFQILI